MKDSRFKIFGRIFNPINPVAQEHLGYPTQKPLALLERIIAASSNRCEMVLDPFCGCGTAIEAAERFRAENGSALMLPILLFRQSIEGRLKKAFGEKIVGSYKIFGRPKDADDARALAARDWLEFQKWAVFALGGCQRIVLALTAA